MPQSVTFPSEHVARDVGSFLARARRVWDGSTRVIAQDGYLQVYVGILMPRGLLDTTPTVLGLRVAPLAGSESLDIVVPIESLTHRIDQALSAAGDDTVSVSLPNPSPSVQWPAISPPKDGWKRRRAVTSSQLADVARRGVQAIAEAIPDTVGESVLQKVRSEVWGQPMPHKKAIPWAAGFAAETLGLLNQRTVSVHISGHWVRLTTHHGYILIKTLNEPWALPEDED